MTTAQQSVEIHPSFASVPHQSRCYFLDWNFTLTQDMFWHHWQANRSEHYHLAQTIIFRQPNEYLEPWLTGKLTTEQALELVSQQTNLSVVDLLEELIHSCNQTTFINPAIPGLVQQLRCQGSQVYVATDHFDSFSRWVAPALKIADLFDGYLNSAEIGALKAHATADNRSAFFGDFLEQRCLNPQHCLLIDDSPINCIVEQWGINFHGIKPGQDIAPILQAYLG